MCRAKNDISNPGGRRCPAHARERVLKIDERLAVLQVELVEGRNAFEQALNAQVQASINAHLMRLAEEEESLNRERKKAQEAADMSAVGIENIRKEAEATDDADKKSELLARADELEKKLNKQKSERRKTFLKQTALVSAMEEAGVHELELTALLASLQSNTGSSHLRSWETYNQRFQVQNKELKKLKVEAKRASREVWSSKTMSHEEMVSRSYDVEAYWVKKIKKQEAIVEEIRWNLYQTASGFEGYTLDVIDKVDEYVDAIDSAELRGDKREANKQRRLLTEYQGQQESYKKALVEARNVRLSDRKIRESVKPRIKAIMKDAGASEQQIQKALDAYAKPESYITDRKENHWDKTVTTLMHLTPEEAEALRDTEMDSMVSKALTTPTLPKGKTLQDVHSEFVRHHDGGGHRQTTVQGVRREVKTRVAFKQSQVAIIDSYANALGISRSAYLRGQISTGNPFALLNDRSKKNRRMMARKANEFIGGKRGKLREKLESVGGNYWSKGNHERIYFNEEESYKLAGGNIRYYNSGRTSSAYIPDLPDRISNGKSWARSYYDMKTEKFVVEAGDPNVKEAIENAFKKLVD